MSRGGAGTWSRPWAGEAASWTTTATAGSTSTWCRTRPEPQEGRGGPVGDALYRNNGDGTFTDVTKEAGIRGVRRGQGLAVGDYDNDGHSDLYVTAYGTSVLYHNEGNGTFRDVTSVAGVVNRRWGCSTTFLDYDRDGWLDLFVSNYLELDPDDLKSLPCYLVDEYPFCQIAQFRGQASVLYRNNRDGTFTDVSLASGVAEAKGKGMGVVAADLDDDGWIDIFQTNDSTPNFLFKNLGDGRFRDVALEADVGLGPSGNATGAMSADAEDVDGDGRLDLLVTNFNHQGTFLHSNAGDMTFNERGTRLGLTQPTFVTSTFGARFLDHDNDGLIDLFVAVGHPFAPVSKVWPDVRFDGPPFLFENDGRGFVERRCAEWRGPPTILRRQGSGDGRLRQRRRPRRPSVVRRTAAEAPAQRRRQSRPLARRAPRRHQERSRRHRGQGHGDSRRSRAHALPRRRCQLPHFLRPAPPLRPRYRGSRGRARGALAERTGRPACRAARGRVRDAHGVDSCVGWEASVSSLKTTDRSARAVLFSEAEPRPCDAPSSPRRRSYGRLRSWRHPGRPSFEIPAHVENQVERSRGGAFECGESGH